MTKNNKGLSGEVQDGLSNERNRNETIDLEQTLRNIRRR